jgi:hypothetical protein
VNELTVVVVLLAASVLLLVAGAGLRRHARKRRVPEPALPRHRKHRDPYAPVHYDGIPLGEWLREDRTD